MNSIRCLLASVLGLTGLIAGGQATAQVYQVDFNLDTLAFPGSLPSSFLIDFQVYDTDAGVGSVRLDGVLLSSGLVSFDFEDGAIPADFDVSANPGEVSVVDLGYTKALEIVDGAYGLFPTYASLAANLTNPDTLSFRFELTGADQFVVSLYDATTFEPLVLGLTGAGDILSFTAGEEAPSLALGGSATVIPEPAMAAWALPVIIGALWLRRRR